MFKEHIQTCRFYLFGLVLETSKSMNVEGHECPLTYVDFVNTNTNMDKMFSGCIKFSCDLRYAQCARTMLSKWDVSNVKYHRFMFDNCHIDDAYKPKFK